ncbi:MAG TPA: outer membrane protein assembly factor BamA [Xanthobacteraceae bacterium]|nr:outer membrane protein assembly factor BamA [Xanthobacteraceae bacterium]
MRGRFTAGVVSIFIFGLLAAVASQRAQAEPPLPAPITVTGNRYVDAAAIRSHVPPGGRRLDAAALDMALKSLYSTGLFSDVKITRQADGILISVVENPTIDRVAFEGNKKIKDDDLKKAVLSKPNGPLSRAIVHNDAEQIVGLYRQHGYFDVKIDPQTIKRRNGRTTLVFVIKEGDKLAVQHVEFAGNEAFSATRLKGAIKTGESNALSFLTGNDAYNADQIEHDLDLIRRFYLDHGYADVGVRSSASYQADTKDVVVTFTVQEGPQYRFGRVDADSNMKPVDPAPLRAALRTHPGDVYSAGAVEKTVEDATLALAKDGEPFAAVSVRRDRVPQSHIINVTYTVEAAKHVYVERIDIHGNSKTADGVIRREFELVEGDAYNRALMDRAERRLKQLGYFKTVKISTAPGSAPDRVVVNVAVEEQKTGNFSIMGGYSAATGPTVQVGVSERNFLGTGDIAKASVTYGEYTRGFTLGLTDPYALGPRVSLGGELFANENLAGSYQAYNSMIYGARLSTGMPLNDQLGMNWTYSIYNQGLSLDPALGTASLPIVQAAAAGQQWVSSIGNGLTYSTVDNPRNPTEGVRIQTNNEIAGLGGAAKFARNTEDARYYHPLVGDVVGMVRAQGGYVTPWGGQQLPLLNGFFGGPQLVRGFAPNGFGPRDITPGTTQDNIGGNIYWTTSAELQSPMPLVSPDAQLKVALFSDAGSLWATNASSVSQLASLSPSQQIANSRALRASVGASLIWNSPFGALRVDYAYPIAHQSYDVTQRLNFTAGGF